MSASARLTQLALGATLALLCACGGSTDPLSVARWDPAKTEAAFPDVIAALVAGDAAQAVKVAQQRLASNSAPDGLQHYLGLALLETGRMQAARDAFQASIAQHPGNADAHLFLTETFIALGELNAAEPHLRAALFHLPELSFVQLVRAQLAFHQGRSAEAKQGFINYLTAEPIGTRSAEAHQGLAQLAAEEGFENARALHDATAARFVQSHQFLNAYSARLKQDANDADALLGLAMVQLAFLENHDNPFALPPELKQKLLDFAGATLTRVLELDPQSVKAHYNLGFVATRLEHFEQAFAAYARVLELQPDHVPAGLNATRLARSMGQLDRARAQLESIRQHAKEPPDLVRLHGEAALLAEAEGRPKEALAEWRAALAVSPEEPRIQAEIDRLVLNSGG